MATPWHRRVRTACRAALVALVLTGCGRATVTPPPPTPAPVAAGAVPSPTPTAVPIRPTATPMPPSSALAQLGRSIDARSADADQRNTALENRLNAGTTLPPLTDALRAAADANQRAAAAISMLPLAPPLGPYRAVAQYRAETAAAYGTLADAWLALARAAAHGGDETVYQTLAGQATDRFHAAIAAKDQAAIALGLAPEGSAPD